MAYVFVPKKQATIEFKLAGTNNTAKIKFFSATRNMTADDAVVAANRLFAIGDTAVVVDDATRTREEVATDNG